MSKRSGKIPSSYPWKKVGRSGEEKVARVLHFMTELLVILHVITLCHEIYIQKTINIHNSISEPLLRSSPRKTKRASWQGAPPHDGSSSSSHHHRIGNLCSRLSPGSLYSCTSPGGMKLSIDKPGMLKATSSINQVSSSRVIAGPALRSMLSPNRVIVTVDWPEWAIITPSTGR